MLVIRRIKSYYYICLRKVQVISGVKDVLDYFVYLACKIYGSVLPTLILGENERMSLLEVKK